MTETSSKPTIRYDKFTKRHESLVVNEIQELKEAGIDHELNYKVAFRTWIEIRRARGAIMQTFLTQDQLQESFVKEKPTRKLERQEVDRLINLTALASLNNGFIFLTKDLDVKNHVISMQTTVLDKINSYTSHIKDHDSYSKFGNAQVMYTFNEFLINYFQKGKPKTDNLGKHFPFHDKPHPFLDGISVNELIRQTEDKPRIVVLAAAASSGVLEAGIFARYMNKVLKIPTTVDPVFFDNSFSNADVRVMNSVQPRQKPIVIPLDDRVLGTGFSPRMAKIGATEKYGRVRLVMSDLMKSR